MEHSAKFYTVMDYYNRRVNGKRLWDESKVRNAVGKGWITPSEFFEITGIDY